MDKDKMDRLPELEEINASLMNIRNPRPDLAFAWLVALVPTIMACLASYYLMSNFSNRAMLYPVVVEATLIILLWWYYLSGFRWKTDSNGLTVWSIFGHRSVGWHDIEQAETKSEFFRLTSHVLHSKHGIFRIPVAGNTQITALGASIYQHLDKSNTINKIELPKESKTIWTTIPEWIPREILWTNPRRPNIVLLEISRLCMLAGATVWVYYYFTNYSMVHLLTPLMCVPLIFSYYARDKINDNGPVSIQLGRHVLYIRLPYEWSLGISTLPTQFLHIKLNDFTDARWNADGHLEMTGPWQTVLLPYNDQESRILLLGIIRALRERENPIVLTIPDDLMTVLENHPV